MSQNTYDLETVRKRIVEEMADSFDEELEMELDDGYPGGAQVPTQADQDARKLYFRELFRLQGELVKL